MRTATKKQRTELQRATIWLNTAATKVETAHKGEWLGDLAYRIREFAMAVADIIVPPEKP